MSQDNNNNMDDIQRTLGRLEGKVDQLLHEQQLVRGELLEHKGQDKQDFAIVSSRFASVSKRLDQSDTKHERLFTDQTAKFEAATTDQNVKLDSLNDYVNKVKGAWWIIGVLVIVIAGAGATLDWLLNWFHRLHH